MPRILGVDIPANKRLDVALTYIYGVGATRAADVCSRAQLDPSTSTSELAEGDIARIAQILQEEFTVEGDLRRRVNQDIRRLVSINCYRGMRHRRGLPVHGQRTRTNARTRKGAKKTVGAIRDRAARKASREPEV
ncbi:MAG: 30S ribosomal protein S13 [Candidatus Pacebacteria bacterium]|nr:30S ribosomal protein S13 [Candidatus Paceibacterota bacterium]